jgi:hypothetical protein
MSCKPQRSTKSPCNCAADPPSEMPVGEGKQEGNGETMALNKTGEDDGGLPTHYCDCRDAQTHTQRQCRLHACLGRRHTGHSKPKHTLIGPSAANPGPNTQGMPFRRPAWYYHWKPNIIAPYGVGQCRRHVHSGHTCPLRTRA